MYHIIMASGESYEISHREAWDIHRRIDDLKNERFHMFQDETRQSDEYRDTTIWINLNFVEAIHRDD